MADKESWLLAEELLVRGDPAFVTEFRRITDADRLGAFAARWHADRRPDSRRLLFAYLDQPLNAYRHEALVKRLFKIAEKAEDNELMARFLVAFDRSVRRIRRKRRRSCSAVVSSLKDAKTLMAAWNSEGVQNIGHYGSGDRFQLYGWIPEEALQTPETTMPRGRWRIYYDWLRRPINLRDLVQYHEQRRKGPLEPEALTDRARESLRDFRLFTVATRRYLQRRAWRYFRKLGKQHPERYVAAVVGALKCYRDEDVSDGLALLDNWGLMHILFRHSPAVEAKPGGWRPAAGHGLSELKPAPMYEELWKSSPRSLIELLKEGKCRPVRQWAVFMIRRDHAAILQELTPDELFGLLATPDAEVARLAAEVIRAMPDIGVLGVDRLLGLVESPNSETLEIVCDLLADKLGGEHVAMEQALRLALSRPLPAARLGFIWLQTKKPETEADCRALLGLAEALAEPLRPQMVQWLRGVLSEPPHFHADWVLELLDSRHADVRSAGWDWLQAEARARDNVDIWRKLLESPYDDVRLKFVAELEQRTSGGLYARRLENARLDDDLLRFLWASVLLNIHRGGRTKPVVVGQITRRLTQNPHEVYFLLPILAVALRSLRGPEFRSGLAAVVQLAERRAEVRPAIAELLPELKLV